MGQGSGERREARAEGGAVSRSGRSLDRRCPGGALSIRVGGVDVQIIPLRAARGDCARSFAALGMTAGATVGADYSAGSRASICGSNSRSSQLGQMPWLKRVAV